MLARCQTCTGTISSGSTHNVIFVDTKQCIPHLLFTVFASMTPQASIQTSVETSVRSQDSCTSRTVSDDVSASEGASVSPRPSFSTQSEGSQKPLFGGGCGIQNLMYIL